MKNRLFSLVIGMLMVSGSAVFAGEPVLNVSPKINPNLAAAQTLSRQAYDKISAAQEANEWDAEGHAQRAKDLLEQANDELKLAAEASNTNK
jgi:hypothetical protein